MLPRSVVLDVNSVYLSLFSVIHDERDASKADKAYHSKNFCWGVTWATRTIVLIAGIRTWTCIVLRWRLLIGSFGLSSSLELGDELYPHLLVTCNIEGVLDINIPFSKKILSHTFFLAKEIILLVTCEPIPTLFDLLVCLSDALGDLVVLLFGLISVHNVWMILLDLVEIGAV